MKVWKKQLYQFISAKPPEIAVRFNVLYDFFKIVQYRKNVLTPKQSRRNMNEKLLSTKLNTMHSLTHPQPKP